MKIDTPYVILGMWGFTFAIAFGAVGWGAYAGLRLQYDLIFWRRIKLFSSCLGVIGLVLLLLNLEKTVRDTLGGRSKELALADFYETKFFTTQYVSIVCSHKNDSLEAKNDCWDATNADNTVSSYNILNFKPYTPMNYPPKSSRSAETDKFIEDLNERLSQINQLIPEAANAGTFFSDENRIKFLLLAAILITFSLAGSIGESAYQLGQAQKTIRELGKAP